MPKFVPSNYNDVLSPEGQQFMGNFTQRYGQPSQIISGGIRRIPINYFNTPNYLNPWTAYNKESFNIFDKLQNKSYTIEQAKMALEALKKKTPRTYVDVDEATGRLF